MPVARPESGAGDRRSRGLDVTITSLHLLRVLTLSGVVVALHGCSGGSSGGSSAERAAEIEVRDAVDRLYTALARADGAGVCRELTASVRQAAMGADSSGTASSCGQSLDELLVSARRTGGLQAAATARVTGVSVDGDDAVARAVVGAERIVLPAERTGNGWKIDSLGYVGE